MTSEQRAGGAASRPAVQTLHAGKLCQRQIHAGLDLARRCSQPGCCAAGTTTPNKIYSRVFKGSCVGEVCCGEGVVHGDTLHGAWVHTPREALTRSCTNGCVYAQVSPAAASTLAASSSAVSDVEHFCLQDFK
ncbi:hypothetical protein E2C01_005429 [Portunus trituberculatus]|uniref:Uncharacterized protein n=1 Tax=Portunus trituberculatus TaxID=210409 RepID=A0A5B7CVI7_PORTR|nr:hypothetical protein [Portunus trituberculatus]